MLRLLTDILPRMQVRRAEIPQVAAAVRELNEADADSIPLAYIVVQKMHHTRFFPTDRNMDRSGNVLPGAPSRHPSTVKSGTYANGMMPCRDMVQQYPCSCRCLTYLLW